MKIVAFQTRRQDATLCFEADSVRHKARYLAKLGFEEVQSPGQQCGGFRGEEIDDGFRNIRQADFGFLCAEVRRYAPERLFAREPDAVDDFVDEPPLKFGAFCQHQLLQFPPAAVAHLFVMGAVSSALEFQEDAGRQHVPIGMQLPFARRGQGGSCVCG